MLPDVIRHQGAFIVHEERMQMIIIKVEGLENGLMKTIERCGRGNLNMSVTTGAKRDADHIAFHGCALRFI